MPSVDADGSGDKFLNVLGDANSIHANLTVDGGTGHDVVTVDDTQDAGHNTGLLTSTQLMGIFGSGGLLTYSNLESLTVDLGDGGNTFTVASTHGSPTTIATTSISTGDGNDSVYVDSIAGDTMIDTGGGDDAIQVGSTTGPVNANPITGSTLNEILLGTLTLTAGTGSNELHAYDSADTGQNIGVLTDTTLTGLGMTHGIVYSGIQTLDIQLSKGNDHFTVASTPAASTLTLHGGTGETAVTNETNNVIDITSIGGTATIYGGDGNDVIRVNYDEHDLQTFQNGLAGLLTLHGGDGSDEYDIGLSGQAGSTGALLTTIDVLDDSPGDMGINRLFIYGTDQPDFFLFRANQTVLPATAMVGAFRVVNGQPDLNGVMERVNYDGFINGGLQVFGRDGNDTFVMDDNLAPTTIFGDAGDDTFQIGQVFASPRDGTNPGNGLDPADFFQTTATTQGFLSNGISAPTTIFGGTGDDSFTVYHNLAQLFLFGQEDDDTFVVRAFVKVNPNDPNAPFTNINGGQGADFISYTVDAPVRIDGGDGLDTLVVLGTEFGDDFVVTDRGVFGAGLYVTFVGIEKVVVDGQAGNDRFYVQSTSPDVDLELVGGLGSDTFDIGGAGANIPITVVSNTLQGHSGLIAQLVQGAGSYANLDAQWVSANVADGDAPGVVITQASPLVVFENPGAPAGMQQTEYSVVLSQAPSEDVRITAAPAALSEQDQLAGGKNIQLQLVGSSQPPSDAVMLVFTRQNWFIPQFVRVSAEDDGLAEGTRFIPILHTVVQGGSADDGGAYDGLSVLSELVQVVDANSATVVVTPYNGSNAPENGLLVAENPCPHDPTLPTSSTCQGGDLPAVDRYAVVLSKQPGGDVTYSATADGETTLSLDGVHWNTTVSITFSPLNGDWNTMRVVYVHGVDDSAAQGLHFSRITQGVTSDAGLLLGLSASDVAAGLAAAVNGDPTGRYRATSNGSTVTVNGLAFTASETAGNGTLAIDASSVHAYVGALTLTLSGTPVNGDIWKLTLNGADIGYGVQAGDTLPSIATALAATISQTSAFTAIATGATLTITPKDPTAPYTAFSTGAGSITPTQFSRNTPAWASLILDVAPATTIELGDAWTISLNSGTTSASAVTYTYVAGSHGETPLLAPLDVEVADDEAPGVLVLQPTGSTNVIEPSGFIVLGDGFVSSVLATCTLGHTCFTGDFGTSELNEIPFHATLQSAQDLDLGSWGLNANPDIADATTVPHITVHGTGDGNSDFYKFSVKTANAQVTLDMDHGFNFGDPILWLSKLKLYNSSGDLIAQGNGFSDPSLGAGGSTTFYDDFLQATLPIGEYTIEVGSWLLTTGLPVGVHYDLQVSVEDHAVAGFVFAPSPVVEDENGNNTTPQSVDDAANWYTFFNTQIGDGSLCAPNCAAVINSQTPYAQILGSGDGSFDLYSFTITDSMLSPSSSTVSPDSVTARGPFYTSVGLLLNGTVHPGDVWKLGIGNQVVSFTAQTTSLSDVAQGLAGLLSAPYSASVTTTSGVVLHISNPDGFSLNSATLSGIAQVGSANDRITRTTTATEADGSTPVTFTTATVTLAGTPADGETWTIFLGATGYGVPVTSGELLSSIATALASAIGAGVATHNGASVVITPASPFTLTVAFNGASPTATATITGTPIASEGTSITGAPGPSQTGSTFYTSATVALPTVRTGDSWTIRLDDGSGGTPVTVTKIPVDTSAHLATAFANDPAFAAAGYTVTANGATVTITSSGHFTVLASVTPAGTEQVDQAQPTARSFTILTPFQAADGWTLELTGSGSLDVTVTASGSATAAGVATNLQNAINTGALSSTFHAVASGASLTVVRLGGGSFDGALSVDGTGSLPSITTERQTVTVTAPAANATVRLNVGPEAYTTSAGASPSASAIATALALLVNGNNSSRFYAVAGGAALTIYSLVDSTFNASLTVDAATTSLATTTVVTLSGSPSNGQTWTLNLSDGTSSLGSVTVHATGSDTLTSIAGSFVSQGGPSNDLNEIDGFYATSSGAAITLSRLGGGALVVSFAGSAAGSTAAATTPRVESVDIPSGGPFRAGLYNASAPGSELTTAAGSDASHIATALSNANISGFSFVASGSHLIAIRSTNTDFLLTIGTTLATFGDTQSATVFTVTGAVRSDDSWNLSLTTAGTTVTGDASGTTAAGITTGLATDLDGATFHAYAVSGGRLVTSPVAGGSSSAAASILAGTGSVTDTVLVAHGVTVTGPVNAGDTWRMQLDTGVTLATNATQTTATGVAAAFAGSASIPSGFTAFSIGATAYFVRSTAFAPAGLAILPGSAMLPATVAGTIDLHYSTTADLTPVGTPSNALGDLWTITVGGAQYTAQVIATITSGWRFVIDGDSANPLDLTGSAADTLARALAAAIPSSQGHASNGVLTIRSSNGSPLAVGGLTEQRAAATLSTSTLDPDVHYSTANLVLSGEITPIWQAGETWTLSVDGTAFTYLVPSTGVAEADRTLATIASGIALSFNSANTDSHLTASANGSTVTIRDTSTGSTDAFTVSLTRGTDPPGVKGIIDIDNANDLAGSAPVPVVLPQWQWLVALYPWAASYFSVTDTVGFTAQPEFELYGPTGTLLATVTCTLLPGTSTCSSTPDAGSAQASDPFLEYTFTQAGTYTVKVGAHVTYNATTDGLGLPNTVLPSGFYGVQDGMHYSLVLSVQHHETNPNALTLEGKQITIVAGPGEGETAKITSYDPETGTYTLDTQWATAPAVGSRFEITESTADLPGYAPATGSYQVVLSSAPSGTVYIDVAPQPTRTYNSADAFDPASNYGQNDLVQVRVQTPRALFLLTGEPAAGETWTILINDRAYSYRVVAGDTLASIAHQLLTAINAGGAAYAASLDPTNADQIVVMASPGAPSFYAGFQISHDLAGGATVSPGSSSAATIAFNGVPAPGETWTLHLDGHDYVTPVTTAGDTLAAVVQRIAALLPTSTYQITVNGTILGVARSESGGGISASVTVSASTPGTITNDFQLYNEAELAFTGTPVAGERWTVTLDNTPHSVVSQDGQSLASVIQSLAALIPAGYEVSVSPTSLFVVHGFGLFGGFFDISLTGSVQLGSSQVYGGAAVAAATPVGVDVALDGAPIAGETWTLDLDGRTFAATYSAGGLAAIASALAALVPSTPAAAQGGAFYAVGVSGSTLSIRRLDQQTPISAAVHVSIPASASTAPAVGASESITFTGTPLDGELWAVSVDGTTYPYVSSGSDTLPTVLAALRTLIDGANYTASVAGSTLTIHSNISTTIDAFGSVVLATGDSQGNVTTTASGTSATVTLAGTVGQDEVWTLTVDGTPYAVTATSSDSLASLAQKLGALVPTGTYSVNVPAGGAQIALSRIDGTTVSASLAMSNLGAIGGSAAGTRVAVDFEGIPGQGEVWTLTVDGTAHVFGVLYGDTLTDIAAGLGKTLPLATYNVSVVGRVLTISRLDGGTLAAGVTISPDSRGGAAIRQQLVFDASNWDLAQTVTVQALDNQIVDGRDALVFPPLTSRVDEIRGPITIDGGLSVNPEPFLGHPLLMPGETNLPLADGTLSSDAGTTASGAGTITDVDATHVSATTGERPGFDPRMNDFAYTVQFLSGTAAGTTLDVASVSKDILSVANHTAFGWSLDIDTSGAVASPGTPPAAYRFIGTPDQSMSTPAGSPNKVSSLTGLGGILWTQADVSFTGLPNVGDVWTLVLGGVSIPYTVAAGDDVASRVALHLADLARSLGYIVEARVGILGDSVLLITLPGGAPFSVGFRITAAPGRDVTGSALVTGTPVDISTLDFTMAAAQLLAAGAEGTKWTLTLGSSSVDYTVQAGDDVGAVTAGLARLISSFYAPLVSGTQVTFKTGFAVDADGHPLVPSAGDEYTVDPLNLNTRVDEATQVDTLDVDNSASPANDTGTLTESHISGFGMGGDTVVSGQVFPGGIGYSNIETLDLHLGSGDNHLTIASTSSGTTAVTTGNGDNTIDVSSIAGHTSITTGSGDDTVQVTSSRSLVQLGGLLTIDTGAGTDTVTVDDSGRTTDTGATLTGQTLTLGPPTVDEEQTFTIRAASGTYTLLLPGAPVHASIALDYRLDDEATIQAKLREAYGTTDIDVAPGTSSSASKTFVVSFTGQHSGLDYGQIEWAGEWTLTLPTQGADPLQLSDPGFGFATLPLGAGAAQVTAALRSIYRTTDVTAALASPATPNVFTVTFTGVHAGLDFTKLTGTGVTVSAVTQLVPQPDASADVTTTTVHDGTTSPDRDVVQTIDLSGATGGSYVLHFVLPNSQGLLQDVATGPILVSASAADILSALSSVLNPNNVNPALPFTDNVGVATHGSTIEISFRGSARKQSIAYMDTSGLSGSAALATRLSGIDYYGVDTLNVDLGSGNDVFDVQGTSAVTNLNTGPGDDSIYVASGANVALGQSPDLLTGTLGGLHGTLNLDGGTGSQRLLISDEGATTGDTSALMTRSSTDALAVDSHLDSTADIFMTGFAPAGISLSARSGDFARGITVWTGFGNDHITVDATHRSATKNEVTSLDTGLGDDNVTVALANGIDGAFVLDAQGPYNDELQLTIPVSIGDYNTPADTVSVTVNGTPLPAGQFVVEPGSHPVVGLVADPPNGATVAVTVGRTTTRAFTLGSTRTVTLTGLPMTFDPANSVTVTVNGAPVATAGAHAVAHVSPTGQIVFDDVAAVPVGALIVVTVVQNATDSFIVSPQLFFTDNDKVDGSASSLPLVLFGGQGSDQLTGGTGGDVIVGDRGRVLWFDPATQLPAASGAIDAATLASLEAAAASVYGHGGPGDRTDGVARLVGLVIGIDPTIGGNDVISDGTGADVIVGGTGADQITANRGETPQLQDGRDVVVGDTGFADFAATDHDGTTLDRAWTSDPGTGGSDTITTGNAADVVLGGDAGDTIGAGNGDNVVVGDNGDVTFAAGKLLQVLSTATGVDSAAQGGDDRITTGSGNDAVVGGLGGDTVGAGDGSNVVFGDSAELDYRQGTGVFMHGFSIAPVFGGDDQLTTGIGSDVVVGGIGSDTIVANLGEVSGDDGVDVVVGDNGSVVFDGADGSLATLDLVQTTNPGAGGGIDSITTGGSADVVIGGDLGDTIGAGNGDNVVLGDNGTISFFGGKLLQVLSTETGADGPLHGGADSITTGSGNDTIVGGYGDDVIGAGGGNNVVFGDSARLDYQQSTGLFETGRSLAPEASFGGDDQITTGIGSDVVVGGSGSDVIVANSGEPSLGQDLRDVVVGDNGLVDFNGSDHDLTTLDLVQTIDPEAGGGVDSITTGGSGDVVIGGDLGDTIGAGNGDNVVLGDNGTISFFGGKLLQVLSTETGADGSSHGGNDRITTGSGNDTVVGGLGGDTVGAGDGSNVVFGDSAELDYQQGTGVFRHGSSLAPSNGGDDRITTGVGTDIVVGGIGSDTIVGNFGEGAVTDGVDVVIGDNGNVVFDGADGSLATLDLVQTINPEAGGGVDSITTGGSGDVVIGGDLGDTIGAGNGDNVVLGDNGTISFYGGKLLSIVSTEAGAGGHGGADSITTGSGNDTIVGGLDADTIAAGDGNNIVFGDSAELDYGSGIIQTAFSTSPSFGGNDTITTGTGNDVIVGGIANDTITTGDGINVALGDNGQLVYGLQAGVNQIMVVTTTSDAIGGNDTIRGGAGQDVLLGGTLNDMVDGGAGNDLVIGDNAVLDRTSSFGNDASPLFRALAGTQIYDATTGASLVTGVSQLDPQGSSWWSDFQLTLLDLGTTAGPNTFGDDYLAGGAGNDQIFGENGNDVIQGDGSIGAPGGTLPCGSSAAVGSGGLLFSSLVGACRGTASDGTANTLFVAPSVDHLGADGNDYIEGGAGSDVVFGNQGQDNIIGGSSNLFGQTSAAQRSDASNMLFGGSGTEIGINDPGDPSGNGHANDADVIVANNGLILDLVGTNGTSSGNFPTFNYDNGPTATTHVIPRAVTLLDYTPGGPTYAGTEGPIVPGDVAAATEVHGEAGDDVIYGGGGWDVLYGDGQNDVIVGGYGSDWIDGGTGDDGILGDDGRMLVSRISSSYGEPLYGVAPTDPSQIDLLIGTSSGAEQAIVNPNGSLKYTAFLLPDNLDPAGRTGGAQNPTFRPPVGAANDVIYGGLGDDSIHGGAGDDAISGAEAPVQSYTNNYDANGNLLQADLRSDFFHPLNPGNVLGYDPVTTDARYSMFALYDNNNPLREILLTPNTGALYGGAINGSQQNSAAYHEWLLDFDYLNGPIDTSWIVGSTYPGVPTDGNDMLFGDLQNDWVVGGTGRDILLLGWGDDLGNIDDRLDTDNGLNDLSTDTNPSYEDVVFGGAGRDAMIGNTGGDREIDWSGEFNSFMGPFNPYGQPTTSRDSSPDIVAYLMALGSSAGADQTLAARHGSDPARDGEPYGELGIVTSSDPQWGDQKGSSRDPQPGTANSTRDVRTSAGTQVIQAPGTSSQSTGGSAIVHAPATVGISLVTAVPIVVGGTAGSTAVVTVTDGIHTVTGSGTIGTGGELTLTLDLSPLSDGALTVSAAVSAPQGGTTTVSTGTFKDTVRPGAPTVTAPASVDATSDTTFGATIAGEPGLLASWTVTDGINVLDGFLTLDATGHGSFTTDVSSLVDGTLTTSVTLTDAAGNQSAAGTAATTKNTVGAGVGVTAVASDSTGSEQGQDPLVFVVSRSGSTTSTLTVTLAWSGTATFGGGSGGDYTVTVAGGTMSADGKTLTIASGSSHATITITPVDDTALESTETVTMAVGAGTGYTVGSPAAATGTITDNDATPVVSASATDAAGAEQGSDPIVFTVTRTLNDFNQIVVTLGWSGSATFGTDYVASATGGTLSADGLQLTLAAGVDSATITLTPVDDSTIESTETAILTLGPGTGYAVGSPASATGSIADNDAVAIVTIAGPATNGSEQGPTPMDFTVTRTANTIKQLVFNLTWSGTATFGTDYTVTVIGAGATLSTNKQQLTLAPGVASAILRVTPIDDTAVESSETVIATLGTGTGYTVGTPSSATGSILDNDGTPVVSVSATDAAGAEQGNDPIVFTLTRTVNPYTTPVVALGWSGAATFGTDYTVSATGGTLSADGRQLTLGAGQTTITLTVSPIDDTLFEGAEGVTVTIGTGTGYSVGSSSSASGTIADNDVAPTVSVTAGNANGSEQGPVPITFVVTRTANSSGQITIGLTWSGTATRGTDYNVTVSGGTLGSNAATLTLADGVTSATITATPIDDTTVESTETVILTLASGTGYAIGTPSSATGSITDNDGTPVVAVTATDSAGSEQGRDPIVFTLTRTVNPFRQITVNLTWSGTASFTGDYTVSVLGGTLSANGLQLTLAAGATTATVTITPIDDTAVESAETVTLTLGSGTGYSVGTPSSATGTIADNDGTPVVSASATDASGAEQGSDPITFAITRSVNPNTQVVVTLAWSGTATYGIDYTVTVSGGTLSTDGKQLTLAIGTVSATLTVTPIDDTLSEGTETVTLTLASGTGYAVGASSSASGTIADNEPVPPAPPAITTSPANTTSPFTISGTGISGATILLYDGATQLTTSPIVVGSNGAWSATLSLLPGAHTITARQTVGGLTSQASAGVTFTVFATPPAPTITSATVGTVKKGVATVTVTGTGVAGDTVTLYDGTTAIGTATVGSGGSWSLQVSLASGTHVLSAKQTQVAGVTSPSSATRSVTV